MSQSKNYPSPDDVTNQPPITWWRPGWRDIVAGVGWTWIILATMAAGAALAVAVLLLVAGLSFAGFLLKPAILVVGGAIALIGHVVHKGIQARQEPFCIFCGYCLTGLPDHHRCPECGRAYTWRQIDDYRRDPRWFIERWNARRELPAADPPLDTGPARPRRRSRDGTD